MAAIAVIMAFTALCAAALAGWLNHGTSILYTYAQDGLSWCF